MNSLYWIFVVMIAMIVFIFIISRRQNKGQRYDERQEAIRNRSFKYGFLTTAIAEGFVLFIGDHLNWPISASLIPLLIGSNTIIIYDIFQRSYFPFKEKHRRSTALILFIIGLVNTILRVQEWSLDSLADNLSFLIMWLGFVLMGIAIFYTDFKDKRDHE